MISRIAKARRHHRRRLKACRWLLASVALGLTYATASSAAETCRFEGSTDYAGHASVVTTAAATGDIMRVDVAIRFEATAHLWLHLRYLVEEISEWRNGTLLRLDANTRYVFGGHVVRQQWDDFLRTKDGLHAYRIQGKRAEPFTSHYPLFAQHWDLADFGADWLKDYAASAPDRRPDLDLALSPPSAEVQAPFALAFYWVRFLHARAQHAEVFLPGFKAGKLADVALTPAPTLGGGRLWRASLHHSYLSEAPPSSATAHISADGRLALVSFELHGSAGSARGSLHQEGCWGEVGQGK